MGFILLEWRASHRRLCYTSHLLLVRKSIEANGRIIQQKAVYISGRFVTPYTAHCSILTRCCPIAVLDRKTRACPELNSGSALSSEFSAADQLIRVIQPEHVKLINGTPMLQVAMETGNFKVEPPSRFNRCKYECLCIQTLSLRRSRSLSETGSIKCLVIYT